MKNGVTIVGHLNVPSRLATDASALYAKNILNLLTLLIDKEKKELEINWDDDIVKGVALTRGGKIVHPNFGGEKPAEKPAAEAPKAEPKKEDFDRKLAKKKAAPKKAANE